MSDSAQLGKRSDVKMGTHLDDVVDNDVGIDVNDNVVNHVDHDVDCDVETLIDRQADCSWRGVDVSLPCLGQALPSPR